MSSGALSSARSAKKALHARPDRRFDHPLRFAAELLAAVEREGTQRVDDLTLLVHHVVVLEQPLARLEVLELDALLGLLDGARDQRVGEHLTLLGAHRIHQLCDSLGAEQTHQIVFERQEELRRARITLTTRASTKLPIDAP